MAAFARAGIANAHGADVEIKALVFLCHFSSKKRNKCADCFENAPLGTIKKVKA